MHCCCQILPPFILDKMAESKDPAVRGPAIETIKLSSAARERREIMSGMPFLAVVASATGGKNRMVHDMKQRRVPLPGTVVRKEGSRKGKNATANEAYDYSGITYDFFQKVMGRNSLDGAGMTLTSSIHYGRDFNNAFWNGEQMVYGDGDAIIFTRFTKSLDVVAHELTHGVVSFTSNLDYQNQSGALNEHFADVFGVLVKQWSLKQEASKADWLIGAEIMVPRKTVKALRSFLDEPGYSKDPHLGTDPQPKHMKDIYTGTEDYGGVHINSGIPNHAFYLAAMELGGKAWEKLGKVWFKSMKALTNDSDFADMVSTTSMIAGNDHGQGSLVQKAVDKAWKSVGF